MKQSRKRSQLRDVMLRPHEDDVREAIDRLRAAGFDLNTREELERLRPWGYGENWLAIVDHVVVGQRLDVLLASVQTNLDLSGMPLRVAKGARGIELVRRKSIATIHATHASFPSDQKGHRDQVVPGDYLSPGPQWGELRKRLVMRYPSLDPLDAKTAAVAPESSVLLTSLPEYLPLATRTTVLEASRRIREERSHDYGEHVARVSGDDFTLRFRPIRLAHGAVEAPFTFTRYSASAVDAALRLGTPTDPLAIAFDGSVSADTVVDAWLVALVCFAELTCTEPPDEPMPGVGHNPRPQTDGRPRTRSRSAYRRSGGPTVGAGLNLAGANAPVASHVAGHRRRLAAGQQCGSKAREFANAIGITLAKTGETWVRSHPRGIPRDAELEFVWNGPGFAQLSTARTDPSRSPQGESVDVDVAQR